MIRCVLVTVNPDINLFTIRRFTMYDWDYVCSLSALKQAFKRVTSIVHRLIVNRFIIDQKAHYNPNTLVDEADWLLNCPFRFSPSFGLISSAFFISSMEPSLSPFSNLARPRS